MKNMNRKRIKIKIMRAINIKRKKEEVWLMKEGKLNIISQKHNGNKTILKMYGAMFQYY